MLVILNFGINHLAKVASFMFLVTYGLVHVAIIQLRRNNDEYDPEFRMPDLLSPIVPIFGVLATPAIMTQMGAIVIAVGLALAIAGAMWYLLYIRHLKR